MRKIFIIIIILIPIILIIFAKGYLHPKKIKVNNLVINAPNKTFLTNVNDKGLLTLFLSKDPYQIDYKHRQTIHFGTFKDKDIKQFLILYLDPLVNEKEIFIKFLQKNCKQVLEQGHCLLAKENNESTIKVFHLQLKQYFVLISDSNDSRNSILKDICETSGTLEL